jgi:hypothetical protein
LARFGAQRVAHGSATAIRVSRRPPGIAHDALYREAWAISEQNPRKIGERRSIDDRAIRWGRTWYEAGGGWSRQPAPRGVAVRGSWSSASRHANFAAERRALVFLLPAYLFLFFSCLASFFSLAVFCGFFFSVFFLSIDLDM